MQAAMAKKKALGGGNRDEAGAKPMNWRRQGKLQSEIAHILGVSVMTLQTVA
jgi:hypothetical protein